MKQKKRVAVLMGGWSNEREISLSSGRGALQALQEKGYDAYAVEVTRDAESLIKALTPKPDVVFLCALHGQGVEDGCIQGLLEIMDIPYTNSSPLSSALGMDKGVARTLFKAAGVPIADGAIYSRQELEKGHVMAPPYVAKVIDGGSSLGVVLVRNDADLKNLSQLWQYGDRFLVERYIPGREILVLVMGNQALGALEVRPKDALCDYDSKYKKGESERIMPAPIDPGDYEKALSTALKAYQALGCEGVARVDLRYDDTQGVPGQFYVLEINTQPGMTPTSFAPLIAAHKGITYGDLVEWMVENPRCPH